MMITRRPSVSKGVMAPDTFLSRIPSIGARDFSPTWFTSPPALTWDLRGESEIMQHCLAAYPSIKRVNTPCPRI